LPGQVEARDAEAIEHVELVAREMVDARERRTSRSPEAGMVGDDEPEVRGDR